MHRLAALAALAAALAAPAVQAATTRAPAVRLTAVAPVTVRGAGFAALEQVSVTLTRNGRTTLRRTRASGRGAFTVRFGLLVLEPCRGTVVVRATGDRGSRAWLRRPCRSARP